MSFCDYWASSSLCSTLNTVLCPSSPSDHVLLDPETVLCTAQSRCPQGGIQWMTEWQNPTRRVWYNPLDGRVNRGSERARSLELLCTGFLLRGSRWRIRRLSPAVPLGHLADPQSHSCLPGGSFQMLPRGGLPKASLTPLSFCRQGEHVPNWNAH